MMGLTKQIELLWFVAGTLMEVVISNEHLGKLTVGVITLLDIVQPGHGFNINSRRVIQFPDKGAVVVREQEFPLDVQQDIPQTDVVLFRKAILPNIFVIALRFKIGRIAIEKAHRAVVLPDELFIIFILDDHLGKPPIGLLDRGEI